MKSPSTLRTLLLEGTPRERGRIHGESLRTEILELIAWRDDGLQQAGVVDLDEYLDRLVEETGFLEATRIWTPDLLEEVEGIGEGAGVGFRSIFANQLSDEIWWFIDCQSGLHASDVMSSSCSALGVFGEDDRPPLLAQTADLSADLDGYQTLLHIKHAGLPLEELVVTIPGWIGIYGLNNQGIGVCINNLVSSLNLTADGLGTLFIPRGILAKRRLDDAIAFLHQIQHSCGQNYTIGGPERVVAYECSPNKICQFIPCEGATRVYHTNHPLVNDDVRPGAQASPDSQSRLNSLVSRLGDLSEAITVERIRAILSSHDSPDHPICRHKRPDWEYMTCACLIMVLSATPELHIAAGPPCTTEFSTIRF